MGLVVTPCGDPLGGFLEELLSYGPEICIYTLVFSDCMFYSAGYHGYCSVEETNSVSFPDIISAIW